MRTTTRRWRSRPARLVGAASSVLVVGALALFVSPMASADPASDTTKAADTSAAEAAKIGRNDYPYRNGAANRVDRWNFFTRQCTSFAAWRLNHDNNVPFHNHYRGVHWGNAEHWDNAARQAGIRVNETPRRGTIAVFNPGVQGVGSAGHVAYVARVDGNRVLIEDYNWDPLAYEKHWVSRSGLKFIHLGRP